MDATQPHYAGLMEIAAQLRAGSMSSTELTRHLLDRIAAVDPQVHAFRAVTPERALAQAAQADADLAQGLVRGPLHGVPIAVKDALDAEDPPAGTPPAGWLPTRATVVTRLTDAGAVLVGSIQTTEGSWLERRPSANVPINPWDADVWTGTSDSGAGVALSAGLCFGVVATDTGGSIRFPAAASGLTGVKPTRGRVSRHGVFVVAESLDNVGPVCRSAADAAVLLRAIAGHDELDPTTVTAAVPDYSIALAEDLGGLRVGVDPAWTSEGVDPEVVGVVVGAADALRGLGAEVVNVAMPGSTALRSAWTAIAAAEASLVHADDRPDHPGDFGTLGQLLDLAECVSGMDVVRAQHARDLFARDLDSVFEFSDVLLMPTQPRAKVSREERAGMARSRRAMDEFMRFVSPFNLTGHPALSLPGGCTASGQPIAFQLVARPLAESLLFRAAYAFQQITDWHTRHPAI